MSSSSGFAGSTSRSNQSIKNTNESVSELKQTIKELRELLKQKDSQILNQKLTINWSKQNESEDEDDDKGLLLKEIQKLNNFISKISYIDKDLSSQIKDNTINMQKEAEDIKVQLANSEKSKFAFYFCLSY